eukprot:12551394-Ditylum_brightwellii.AAC.1
MKRGTAMRSVENGIDSCENHLTHGTGRRIEFRDQDTLTTKREMTMQSDENGIDGGENHLTYGTGYVTH